MKQFAAFGLGFCTCVLGLVIAPSISANDFVAWSVPQAGRDSATAVVGGCDGDGYMDGGETVQYSVTFKVLPGQTCTVNNVAAALSAELADCVGPSGNAVPGLVISGSPVTFASVACDTPVTASFTVTIPPLLSGIVWADFLLDLAGNGVESTTLVFRHPLSVDEEVRLYSTDYPNGGIETRDLDEDEVTDATIAWSSAHAGKHTDGTPVDPNPQLTAPWNFDTDRAGFTSGLSSVTTLSQITDIIALWGEDQDFDDVLDYRCSGNASISCTGSGDMVCNGSGVCFSIEDNDPVNGQLDSGWSTAGGCGYQTGQGVWHTGRVGDPQAPTCLTHGSASGQCQAYETISGSTGTGVWYELLATPQVSKVNREEDPVSCSPLARAEIVAFGWNQLVDIPDELATFTWEVDNDCADDTAVDLFDDTVVLGSITGPYGAVTGGTPFDGIGYPMFAGAAMCSVTGAPCSTASDCQTPQMCDPTTFSVNGGVAPDRVGDNSCYFEGIGTIPADHVAFVSLAGPRDDDLGSDAFVLPNGALRNMDIKLGPTGLDLVIETFEDRYGESGSCFQAAFGMKLLERPDAQHAEPLSGFGVALDDVVLEWREIELVPGTCLTPGEVPFMGVTSSTVDGPNVLLDIVYTQACEAEDHAVYFGPCNNPTAYTDADCSIGNTGSATLSFPAGGGCLAFVIVGNTGGGSGGVEGSYGEGASLGATRPPSDLCDYVQVLDNTCD